MEPKAVKILDKIFHISLKLNDLPISVAVGLLFAQCFHNSWKILTSVFHNLYPSCQQYANFQRLRGMGKWWAI